MARNKERTHSKANSLRKTEVLTSSDKLELKDYVFLNLIFYAFCIVQLIIVRLLLRDFAGLYFFFGFIMCAFLVASVFDFVAEKLDVGVHAEDNF